jgi:membrane-associated phospholipid phosphatase
MIPLKPKKSSRRKIWLFAIFSCFLISTIFWHWLGPIIGRYDFISAIEILNNELNSLHTWVLFITSISTAIYSEKNLRNDWKIKITSSIFFLAILIVILIFLYAPPNGFKGISIFTIAGLGLSITLLNTKELFQALLIISITITAYLLIGYGFTILKLTAFMNGANSDIFLKEMDVNLGLDQVRQELISQTHKSNTLKNLADFFYQLILPTILMFSIAAAISGKCYYTQYGYSMFFVYFIGGVAYFAFPAWGPFTSLEFKSVATDWFSGTWRVGVIQEQITQNSLKITQGDYRFEKISPFAFVSAMPSLHVATPAVPFFLFGKEKILIKILALIIVLISTWSALVTGMHYFVDILSGLILAWVSVKLSDFFNQEKT